jgi:hypothetical protein
MLDALPGQRFRLTIDSIARKEADQLPPSLSQQNGGSILSNPPAKPGGGQKSQGNRPSDEHFEARVRLPSLDVQLSTGLRGQARILVGYKTLFQRGMMLAFRNLRKKLQ